MVNTQRLGRVSACAGIHDNGTAAFKARVNHYGSYTNKVPARRWVDMADLAHAHTGVVLDIQAAIKDIIKDEVLKDRTIKKTRPYYGSDNSSYEELNYYDASPFAPAWGPARLAVEMSRAMRELQTGAILMTVFRPGPTNGGDPYNNAPSTIRRKGRNQPLVDTEELLNSIDAWKEDAR